MAISAGAGREPRKGCDRPGGERPLQFQKRGLREGVRLVQEREARLRELKAKFQLGSDDVEAGRVKPIGEVFDRLIAKYEAMAKAQS